VARSLRRFGGDCTQLSLVKTLLDCAVCLARVRVHVSSVSPPTHLFFDLLS
jgi:hypothetical protein